MSETTPDLQRLVHAALRGGIAALEALPGAKRTIDKPLGDFATEADLASERVITEMLRESYPHIPIVGEESWQSADLPETFFAVDPFDGTIIASRGCPEWGVLVTYIESRTPKQAVLLQPQMGRIVTAERGAGCFLEIAEENKEKRRIDPTGEPDSERLVVALDVNFSTSTAQIERSIFPLAVQQKVLLTRTLGSAINGIIELMLGRVDAYICPSGGKVWDFAPGAVVLEELGGKAYLIDQNSFSLQPFTCDAVPMGVVFARTAKVAEVLARLFESA
ncbi:MAG: inositol monophosphatase family protein [Bdellovibrionota bacterium]